MMNIDKDKMPNGLLSNSKQSEGIIKIVGD